MQLEDYFEFEKHPDFDNIRIKGTGIAIEVVLRDYLGGSTPEQIAANYRRSIGLEQVFATLTYYLHNKQDVDAYLERVSAVEDANYQEYLKKGPSDIAKKLQAIKAQRQQAAEKPA